MDHYQTFLLFLVHLLFCEALPPPSLYLGLYSESKTDELREFTRDSYQKQCYSYTAGDNSTEHCRFYGDCCVDPMRVRERLEPGTFSCLKNPASSGNFFPDESRTVTVVLKNILCYPQVALCCA